MKTVEQRAEEMLVQAAAEAKAKERWRERQLAYIKAFRLHPPSCDINKDSVALALFAIEKGHGEIIGTACGRCGAALVDLMAGHSYYSRRFDAVCPCCGRGYYRISIENRVPWEGGDLRDEGP